jgi:hypothetical protein
MFLPLPSSDTHVENIIKRKYISSYLQKYILTKCGSHDKWFEIRVPLDGVPPLDPESN